MPRASPRSRSCGTAPSRPGGSTSGTWCRRSGRRRTATRSRSPGCAGDQISRLGAHFDPILAVFAPLWLDLAEPRPAAREPGGRGCARRAARLLARAQAPRLRASGPRLRARVPALSANPVADPERVPPRRPRLPAAALCHLVPRRGPAAAVRRLRSARGHDEGGGRVRGRRARRLVRLLASAPLAGRRDLRGRDSRSP